MNTVMLAFARCGDPVGAEKVFHISNDAIPVSHAFPHTYIVMHLAHTILDAFVHEEREY